jgi:hypothetical protein
VEFLKPSFLRSSLLLAVLAVLSMLVAGYHPGGEDDGVYLAAIKHDLNPTLFPRDAEFFTLQLQATVFDKLIAASVRLSHLSLGTVCLLWQYLAILTLLFGCWRIIRRCFAEEYAQWAGVAMIAALLTLPVAGTALYLFDQNLHPRGMASGLILLAVDRVLGKRLGQALAILAAAFLLHPIMAAFGASFCAFLVVKRPREIAAGLLLLSPMSWVFEPTSAAWRVAANTRTSYFLSRWEWYEWLGVIAPFLLLWWFARMGRRAREHVLSHLSLRLMAYGVFQFAVALVLVLPPALDRFKPWQPMRYLHLLYLLMFLLIGGLAGQRLLRTHVWRWAVLFLPLALGMFLAQRATYPGTPHIELPGVVSSNPWLQAFDWIRTNTPTDSYFALGADYMRRPDEDYHGFRALAERSVLADRAKDAAVVTQVPRLADRWLSEVEAQRGWEHFGPNDFQRLKLQFGVNWVVIEQPGVEGLTCPYQNSKLRVCRI